jgi:hypothetical protein
MLTRDEARERVARGVAHLDRMTHDWADRIDVKTLRISQSCNCVLAQVYNTTYSVGMMRAELVSGELIDLGFTSPDNDPGSWRILQNAWEEVIFERQRPSVTHQRDGGGTSPPQSDRSASRSVLRFTTQAASVLAK